MILLYILFCCSLYAWQADSIKFEHGSSSESHEDSYYGGGKGSHHHHHHHHHHGGSHNDDDDLDSGFNDPNKDPRLPKSWIYPDGYFIMDRSTYVYAFTRQGVKKSQWLIDLIGAPSRNGVQDKLFRIIGKPEEGVAVFTSTKNGRRQREERSRGYPFKMGAWFNLTIVNTQPVLQLYVNRTYFGFFKHRTPNPSRDYVKLYMDGALKIDSITFPKQPKS